MQAVVSIALATGAAAQVTPGASTNLFTNPNGYYLSPEYQQEIQKSINNASGQALVNLKTMQGVGHAFWVSDKAAIHGTGTSSMQGILKDASQQANPELVVFVLYNLPNRNCDSKNSHGEICCTTKADGTCDYTVKGNCTNGLNEYKTEYVDPIVALLSQYAEPGSVQVALVIEPGSLPNLATNKQNPACANTATIAAYTLGIPYLVNQVAAAAPGVSMYIDAAHGGWLGWDDNAQAYASVLSTLRITDKLRGMASNVANFQPLGVPCPASAFSSKMHIYCQGKSDPCCVDPCGLIPQWSAGNNEYNYIQAMMLEVVRTIPDWHPHFIIDTGRNGVPDARSDCANWCNIRGSGVGASPSSQSKLPQYVDALFWLKSPGESDGCTKDLPDGTACDKPGKIAMFDQMCASKDSIGTQAGDPRAPQAGLWFDYEAKMLATNANFNPPIAHEEVRPAPAFGACKTHIPCAEGYSCAENGLCMPSAERIEEAQHSAVFATQLEHAQRVKLPAAAPQCGQPCGMPVSCPYGCVCYGGTTCGAP